MQKISDWIKENKIEFGSFVAILVIAAFMRFYNISEYMTFLGDEGRDALVVKKILTEFDFPLLGAPTSVGGMYNGPLYYYMMAVAMAISWLNPVAAASMVALIGTATVGLIYYLSRMWFGKAAAIVSATLYAFSPVTIIYSHSSWNPNPAPFFALIAIFGLYRIYQTKNHLWLALVGASLAFAVQMHFLALILLPICGVIWLNELREKHFNKKSPKHLWQGLMLGILAFLFLMSPLLIFDLKYDFQNYKAFNTFFFGDRATTVNLNPLNTVGRVVPIYSQNLVNRYVAAEQFLLGIIISLLLLIPLLYVLFRAIKSKVLEWPLFALSVWLVFGVMGLALYKQTIYDHYSSFLSPALFLLFGSILYLIRSKIFKKFSNYLLVVYLLLTAFILFVNIQMSPLKKPPNRQLQRTQDVARFVIVESNNKPFNFALIAKSNYDDAYEFYLDLYGHKPKVVPFEKTEQLFVVCEDKECIPINHPKYEIAAFGWAKIENEKEFSGVRVFKLVPNNAQLSTPSAEIKKQ
jgi:4-amino-4-deoxy-L-arabinose transferase-like glycosyltransferase